MRNAPANEPQAMTMLPPKRSINRPMVGAINPPVSSPPANPPMAKVIDQPRSAAISGTVNTGG